jgi:hypothetical protein
MSIIESAGVRKHAALVDEEGRLQIFGAFEGEDRHINQSRGKMWSVPFDVTTTAVNAYVSYIKNTGASNLHITDVRANNAGTASEIEVDWVTGVPGNTSPVEAVNRNLGNPTIPTASLFEALDGTGITGLVDEGRLFPKFAKANDDMHLRTTSNIIIPPGQAAAIKVLTSGAALRGDISLVEVEIETGAR